LSQATPLFHALAPDRWFDYNRQRDDNAILAVR
jgi:hypothetical protein